MRQALPQVTSNDAWIRIKLSASRRWQWTATVLSWKRRGFLLLELDEFTITKTYANAMNFKTKACCCGVKNQQVRKGNVFTATSCFTPNWERYPLISIWRRLHNFWCRNSAFVWNHQETIEYTTKTYIAAVEFHYCTAPLEQTCCTTETWRLKIMFCHSATGRAKTDFKIEYGDVAHDEVIRSVCITYETYKKYTGGTLKVDKIEKPRQRLMWKKLGKTFSKLWSSIFNQDYKM